MEPTGCPELCHRPGRQAGFRAGSDAGGLQRRYCHHGQDGGQAQHDGRYRGQGRYRVWRGRNRRRQPRHEDRHGKHLCRQGFDGGRQDRSADRRRQRIRGRRRRRRREGEAGCYHRNGQRYNRRRPDRGFGQRKRDHPRQGRRYLDRRQWAECENGIGETGRQPDRGQRHGFHLWQNGKPGRRYQAARVEPGEGLEFCHRPERRADFRPRPGAGSLQRRYYRHGQDGGQAQHDGRNRERGQYRVWQGGSRRRRPHHEDGHGKHPCRQGLDSGRQDGFADQRRRCDRWFRGRRRRESEAGCHHRDGRRHGRDCPDRSFRKWKRKRQQQEGRYWDWRQRAGCGNGIGKTEHQLDRG